MLAVCSLISSKVSAVTGTMTFVRPSPRTTPPRAAVLFTLLVPSLLMPPPFSTVSRAWILLFFGRGFSELEFAGIRIGPGFDSPRFSSKGLWGGRFSSKGFMGAAGRAREREGVSIVRRRGPQTAALLWTAAFLWVAALLRTAASLRTVTLLRTATPLRVAALPWHAAKGCGQARDCGQASLIGPMAVSYFQRKENSDRR